MSGIKNIVYSEIYNSTAWHEESCLERQSSPDCIVTTQSWKDTAKKALLLAGQIILFPWGLYELLRYCSQRSIMTCLYPAQSRIMQYLYPDLSPLHLDRDNTPRLQLLIQDGFLVRRVTLERDGVRYDGLLIGKKEHITNGQWVLQATGNHCPIEIPAPFIARCCSQIKYNTLFINGPHVGHSKGHATPQTMGEAQDTALLFLETAIKATHIVCAGHSLGGAAIGLMIPMHTFRNDIRYLVVRQMTFDRSANVCAKALAPPKSRLRHAIRWLIQWTHLQMDSVLASRILSEKGIHEIIVQTTTTDLNPSKSEFMDDGTIPAHATLGYRLQQEDPPLPHKTFLPLIEATHYESTLISMPLESIENWTQSSHSL